MTEYTTEIIDNLRGCETVLKAFENEKAGVVIETRISEGMYVGMNPPFYIEKDTPLAKSLISLLKAEAWRLKRELQQNLDIADVIHYEE